MVYRSLCIVFGSFLFLPFPVFGQDEEKEPTPWWERGEEEKVDHWFFRGIFTGDFYPFGVNNRTNYESVRGFNYSIGGELLYTEEGTPNAYGGGIIYSFKDYKQQIIDNDSATNDEDIISGNHEIRYVEIPIVLQRDMISNEKNRVFLDASLLPGLMDHAESRYKLNNDSTTRRAINDTQFARFLLGIRIGGGFSARLSESFSAGTGVFTKFYLTDLFQEQYANFSSIGLRLNITYHIE